MSAKTRGSLCVLACQLLGQEGRPERRALELIVSRFSDADIEPVMDMLSAVEDSDEVDAVDIVYSNNRLRTVSGVPSLKWELLFQSLRAAGSKLRTADLRNNYIRGDALRYLIVRLGFLRNEWTFWHVYCRSVIYMCSYSDN